MFSTWYGCETCRRSFLKLDDLFQHKEDHGFEERGVQSKEQTVSLLPSANSTDFGSRRKFINQTTVTQHNPFVLARRLTSQEILSKNSSHARYIMKANSTLPTAKRSPNNVINYFQCKLCLDKCNSDSELTVHLNTCASSHQHRYRFCVSCNMKFYTKHNLKRHISRRHVTREKKDKSIKSKQHGELSVIKVVYEPDVSSHAQLTHTQKKQTQKSSLYFAQKPFMCQEPHCKKTFQLQHYLTRHRASHSDAKPFRCPKQNCERYFKTKDSVRQHMRLVHSDSRPFKCPQNKCGKSFKDRSNFRRHLVTHAAPGSFKCPEAGCLKTFKNRDSARYHILKRHSDLTPNKCPQANSETSFEGKINFREYKFKRSHAKPYKCLHQNCKKAFTVQSQLNRHLEGHSQSNSPSMHSTNPIKPFIRSANGVGTVPINASSKTTHNGVSIDLLLSLKCSKLNCGKRFANKNNLKRHLLTVHSSDKPFKCPVPTCNYKCKEKSSIKQHLLTRIHANLIT